MKMICLFCGQEIEKYEHYLDINGEILHEQCSFDKYGKQEGFDDNTNESELQEHLLD